MNKQLNDEYINDEYINIELSENGDIVSISNSLDGFLSADKSSMWREKKVKNQLVAKAYKRIKLKKKQRFSMSQKSIERVEDCAGILAFKVSANKKTLHQTYFCKNRFCPICAWRGSLRLAKDNRAILNQYLSESRDNRLIFLTLTIRNCQGSDLRKTISRLNYGYKKIRNRKFYKENFCGDIKTIEVTVNRDNLTFHPHLHVVLATTESYFSKDNKNYITNQSWAEIWADAIKQDMAIVDVRAIKKGEIEKANLEISKYISKDSDYLKFREADGKYIVDETKTDYILFSLISQTKSLRFIGYAGILKKIKKDLKIKDAEEYTDADLVDDDDNEQLDARLIVLYRWDIGFSRYLYHDFYFEN